MGVEKSPRHQTHTTRSIVWPAVKLKPTSEYELQTARPRPARLVTDAVPVRTWISFHCVPVGQVFPAGYFWLQGRTLKLLLVRVEMLNSSFTAFLSQLLIYLL